MSQKRNNNKKRTRGTITRYRGYTVKSNLELDAMKALYRDRRQLKKCFDWDYETETLDYTIHSTYTPDFVITQPNGHKVYVEAKGRLDPDSKRKMVAVRKNHPDIDIRFLFSRNQKLYRGAKMTYTEWVERNNFNGWHVGREIPLEWLVGEIDQ